MYVPLWVLVPACVYFAWVWFERWNWRDNARLEAKRRSGDIFGPPSA